MLYKEVADMIATVGLPYAYRAFPESTAKAPPFIVFFYDGNDDLFADNINYQTIVSLRIELYTRDKDFATEAAVESVLRSNEIAFSKEEVYIDDEKLYEIVYESEVVING